MGVKACAGSSPVLGMRFDLQEKSIPSVLLTVDTQKMELIKFEIEARFGPVAQLVRAHGLHPWG